MEKKYTSGPWTIDREWHCYTHNKYYRIQSGLGYHPYGFSIAGMMKEEDAVLIQAAPTLLEALQKIVEMNYQHAEDQYGNRDIARTWACVGIAEEAISKALNTKEVSHD